MNLKDLTKITLSRLNIRNPFNKMFEAIEVKVQLTVGNYCPNVDYERFGSEENF